MEGGFIHPVSKGEGLRCTKEPTEVQELTKEHCSLFWKNPVSNSGLPQEAEVETDYLPETASNCLLG
jgi:hypothetical protein